MWKKEIELYIESHKDEMIEDISELCRINSEKMLAKEGKPCGEGAFKALSAATDMAVKYGFLTTNYDNYVVAVDLNDREPQLDILTHVDVVPAGEGWKVTEPFSPVIKDGRLYARGTADNKGPAIAALYALRAVKELNIPLSKRCRLVFGTDEESGFSDIEHYYSIEKEAPMTFAPDLSFPVVNVEKGPVGVDFEAEYKAGNMLPRVTLFDSGIKGNVVPGKAYAIVEGMEPNDLNNVAVVLTKEIGVEFRLEPMEYNRVKITAIGVGCHASHSEDGNNALTAMLTYLDRLPLAPSEQADMIHQMIKLIPHGDVTGKHLGVAMSDSISGHLSLALTMLHMDEKKLTGHFDSRCPLCANNENFFRVAKETMETVGLNWTKVTMKPPHYVLEESTFIQTLLRVYENYTGRKGECQSRGGYTYVHGLKNGVAFGAAMPETDNHMHGADEFVVLDELLMSAKIFAQVIVELCS